MDGVYDIAVQTPIGEQKSRVTLQTFGNTLSGTSESPLGASSFTGTVDGNKVQWTEKLAGPMGSITITFNGIVEGDEISGQIRTPFGPFSFEGTRRETK